MTAWPSPNDYTAAIQNPNVCFRDSDLKRSTVERHPLTRMPKVWTGNFAQVYELRNNAHRWAVKCFTRSAHDLRTRYARISEAVMASGLPYFVECRLLEDEMLVNGKRYGVVKMQWVDGQCLDKYVEANLFRPNVLVALAGQIVKMVRDLESRGIAHGDLQHGNIILRGTQLTLVDYDGMFIPAFAGHRAPEQGLPSYQHPRRDGRIYDSQLDRFPLIVIATGLYALAIEPALWYQFSTGDNLLFTRADFEHPDRSSLFQKLRASPDGQLRELVELLRSACLRTPGEVPLLEKSLNAPVQARPWWVTAPAPPPDAGPSRGAPPRRGSPVAWLRLRWSLASTLAFLIALAAFYFGGLITIQGVVLFAAIAGAAYVLDRYRAFRHLPVFARRAELEQQLIHLRKEVDAALADQGRLQGEPARLSQRQAQELEKALKHLQSQGLATALSQIDVANLTTIHGIGLAVIGSLRAAGLANAYDVYRTPNLRRVPGIGQKRESLIKARLATWEAEARRKLPTRLPGDIENGIVHQYERQRQAVAAQLAALAQRLASVRGELQRCEGEYAQLFLPTFSQFLRHNL